MHIIHTDQQQEKFIDKPSLYSIRDLMKKDAPAYFEKIKGKENEWIPRILLANGSSHAGSKIPYGCSILYLFKKIPLGFDLGIKEIKIPESMNEFLDLFNEINKDETIGDKQITR